ncbi:cupin domain-containing protein [Actinobacteria bacterium YIM 96077]|uniref:Cupin domain-containing protein n=1 Tax=Phytoactinopolyspora halophila TaxID=1981511 RepID=A0A329QLQ9_9ACTN|nr:cupin domain-containing protein [Phytoactinopolyspora halophila]AYY14486.1 cupin domain-containing protein [Actinobacteria bacterium YIM 96077]RAW11478.1 cupin domain-containing protein [Phytoactinopolyspora halophila]
MSPEQNRRPHLADALDLQPHPEGGWFRETWRSDVQLRPAGYDGERATATCIYFLLAPGEESRWHVVKSAEIWFWHSGGSLQIKLGGRGEAPALEPEIVTLGTRVQAGEAPQVVVPPGVWQSAQPTSEQDVLVSCVVSPGFDFADFHML